MRRKKTMRVKSVRSKSIFNSSRRFQGPSLEDGVLAVNDGVVAHATSDAVIRRQVGSRHLPSCLP